MTEFLGQKHQNLSNIVDNFIEFNPEFQIQNGINIANQSIVGENFINGESNVLMGPRLFRCHIAGCDKDYSNKSRLEIHSRTHVIKLVFL